MSVQEIVTALIRIRYANHLTQSDVASRMCVSTPAIAHFERQRRCPNLSTVLRYADAVGATLTVVSR